MDSIFLLEDGDRAAFLQRMMHDFGCVYICLWSYSAPSNCLLAFDGLYRELSSQASSSQGSLARRLFDVYRESIIDVDTGRIPGLAFKNNIPYMRLQSPEFQRLVSVDMQLQFYQEARIKTAVFMGCAAGEIELGLANDSQVDLEMEMKNMFPLDFSRQAAMVRDLPHQGPTSSSSLPSLSAESTEYSPLLYNIPTSEQALIGEALLEEALKSVPLSTPVTTSSFHDQARQALSQIRHVQFPTLESEDAAMTKAILAVLSSPSTSSSSQQNLPDLRESPSAFRRYRATPSTPGTALSAVEKQNKFKRAVLFFRNLNWKRQEFQGNRPTANQLHHVIMERRRREKLNESFHVLRSLLPPGSKKDKASVLSSTTEYIASLKSQVEELSKRNQMLESQVLARKPEGSAAGDARSFPSSSERINVEITQVSASRSEERFLDLRVSVRGERSMLDLVIRLLEFLRQQRSVTLLSVESNTRMSEAIPVHGLMLRLSIEGSDIDESGFEEGVRRAVDDQPH